MMMKSFFAASATAVMIAGAAAATTVTETWDVFVTSNNNTTTGMQDALYVDPVNAAGTLSFSFDSLDSFPNGNGTSAVFLAGFASAFNIFPSSIDLSLTLGGVMQTWNASDFLIAEATVDEASGTQVSSLDFILLTSGSTASIADPSIVDITPEPGLNFLRFDATSGAITGIEIEIQTVGVVPAPVPVPASLPLLATGALLLGALRKKTKKA